MSLALAANAWALEIPTRDSWVVDRAGALSSQTRLKLNQELERVQAGGGPQVQVVILPSLDGEPIESAALKIAEQYRLGHAGRDNGALLLVALADRQLRIEVGRGLEGDIPDAIASRIIRNVIVPEFQSGRIEQGILLGVSEILKRADVALSSESASVFPRPRTQPPRFSPALIIVLVMLWLIISRMTRPRLFGWGRHFRRGGFGSWPTHRGGWGGGGGWSGGGGGGFSGGGASGRW